MTILQKRRLERLESNPLINPVPPEEFTGDMLLAGKIPRGWTLEDIVCGSNDLPDEDGDK